MLRTCIAIGLVAVASGCGAHASAPAADRPRVADASYDAMIALIQHKSALDACVHGNKVSLKVDVAKDGATTRSITGDVHGATDIQHCVERALEGVVFARDPNGPYANTILLGE